MTATRLVRIDCDGPYCRPIPPTGLPAGLVGASFGSLGGGYVVLPQAPMEQMRRTIADRFGWSFDRPNRRDLCPRCAGTPVPDGHREPVITAGRGTG